MQHKNFIIVALLCYSVNSVAQPTLADTTKFLAFDRVNSWHPTGAELKTYIGVGGGAVATDAIWDAKGDLAVGTGANTAARLAVGSDGKQIYADASESTGLRWGPSVIRPAQITANQTDYNPAGWGEAQTIILDFDASWMIKGFSPGYDGEIKTLHNKSAYPCILPGKHTDATAAWRMDHVGVHVLGAYSSVQIQYDDTDDRWRVINGGDRQEDRYFEYYQPTGSATAGDHDILATAGTGAALSTAAPENASPASFVIGTGTTTSGASAIYYAKTVIDIINTNVGYMELSGGFHVPTLSDGTDTYTFDFSVTSTANNTTLLNNNQFGIRYSSGLNAGDLTVYSRSNAGVNTDVDTDIALAANTKVNLIIGLSPDNSEVMFWVNGSFFLINTNLPADDTGVAPRAMIQKSAGTNSRTSKIYKMRFRGFY